MSGVFFSYTRADRAVALSIVTALRELGVNVWWDEDMPGVDWQRELERQIDSLSAVVVLWTPRSQDSKNVRDEARLALRSEKLVNVLVEATQPPFPFDRVNGLPLDGWAGNSDHGPWRRLVRTIEGHLVQSGTVMPGDLMRALGQLDDDVRRKRAEVAEAKEKLAAARFREQEHAGEAAEASSRLKAAEAELVRLTNLGVSPAILRAAQGEVDASRTARDETVKVAKGAAARAAAAARLVRQSETTLADVARAVSATVEKEAPAPQFPVADQADHRNVPSAAPKPSGVARAMAIVALATAVVGLLTAVVTLRDRVAPPKVPEAKATSGPAPVGAPSSAASAVVVQVPVQPAATVAPRAPEVQPAPPLELSLGEMNTKGTDAFDMGNFDEALAWYRKAADRGYARAQHNVGLIYEDGLGVAADPEEALGWYLKSASQGFLDAQVRVAELYEGGELKGGSRRDEAIIWYRKAAQKGHAYAKIKLDKLERESAAGQTAQR